jgi:urease accessory protein UreH
MGGKIVLGESVWMGGKIVLGESVWMGGKVVLGESVWMGGKIVLVECVWMDGKIVLVESVWMGGKVVLGESVWMGGKVVLGECMDGWKELKTEDKRFADDNEVMEAVQSWLKVTPKKNFFLEGVRKVVDRWTKCIAKRGDYVEK